MLGLDVVGKTSDGHATIYTKVFSVVPDWAALKNMRLSQDCPIEWNVGEKPIQAPVFCAISWNLFVLLLFMSPKNVCVSWLMLFEGFDPMVIVDCQSIV